MWSAANHRCPDDISAPKPPKRLIIDIMVKFPNESSPRLGEFIAHWLNSDGSRERNIQMNYGIFSVWGHKREVLLDCYRGYCLQQHKFRFLKGVLGATICFGNHRLSNCLTRPKMTTREILRAFSIIVSSLVSVWRRKVKTLTLQVKRGEEDDKDRDQYKHLGG